MAKKKNDEDKAHKLAKASIALADKGGIITRLVSIDPVDKAENIVDAFVTEVERVSIPKDIIIMCNACNTLEMPKLLTDRQAIKLFGRDMGNDAKKQYIRKNFGLKKCPQCPSNKHITFTPITYRKAFRLELRDVHISGQSYEFELERSEVAFYIPKDDKDYSRFLKMVEHGQSLRMDLEQIIVHKKNNKGDRVFWIKEGELPSDIVIDDKSMDPRSIRNKFQFKDLLKPNNYTVNMEMLKRSYAQWIGGMDHIKEWLLLWCFSCPTDPWAIMVCGDSQVSKSHQFISLLGWHPKRETLAMNKGHIRDVCLQGENTKKTAFYMHEKTKDDEHWKLKRGIGLRAFNGRLFIDSLHKSNKDIMNIVREAITQRQITIAGAGTDGLAITLPFVSRFGVTFNTVKETHQYKNMYDVYRFGIADPQDKDKLLDYMDLNRFPIKLLISNKTLTTADMTKAMTEWESGMYNDPDGMIDGKAKFLTPKDFIQLKALCDSLHDSNDNRIYFFEEETMRLVNELYAEKRDMFIGREIEFYSNAFRDQVKSILKGMAFISYDWSDEDGKMRIVVKPILVQFLREMLEDLEEMWGLDMLLMKSDAAQDLTMVLWELLVDMKGHHPLRYELFCLIAAKKTATLDYLASESDKTRSNIGNQLRWMIEQQLVYKVKRGKYGTTWSGEKAYEIVLKGPDQEQIMKWIVEATSCEDGVWIDVLYDQAQERNITQNQVDEFIDTLRFERGVIEQLEKGKYKWVGEAVI